MGVERETIKSQKWLLGLVLEKAVQWLGAGMILGE